MSLGLVLTESLRSRHHLVPVFLTELYPRGPRRLRIVSMITCAIPQGAYTSATSICLTARMTVTRVFIRVFTA